MTLKIDDFYKRIYLVEKKSENSASELKSTFPNQNLCICDFYIKGSEHGQIEDSGAITFNDLLLIDHHMALPYFMRQISSTVIANRYVRKNGKINTDYKIIINHTDTDSILSSLIMAGNLPPDDIFEQAAICADHTGKENTISDILQALEDDRKIKGSIDVLMKVLEKRYYAREEIKRLAQNNHFKWNGEIAYIILDNSIDAGLAPAFLPNAKVILIASLMPKGSVRKWKVRVRLGIKGDGIVLNRLGLPDAGGRWNAVSTSRNGGTDIEPEKYVEIIKNLLG
jgi:hypothetical protein